MLTQTSVTAVRILVHLAQGTPGEVVSLKQVAEVLQESPTYLVKIGRHLVRAGLLRAHKGKTGGVVLNRAAEGITLLAVVEACQGTVHGDFCQDTTDLSLTCAFHQAGAELHKAIVGVLTNWTLDDLLKQPCPARELQGKVHCLLQGGRPGLLPTSRKARR
jgi:Rrf2 family protein